MEKTGDGEIGVRVFSFIGFRGWIFVFYLSPFTALEVFIM